MVQSSRDEKVLTAVSSWSAFKVSRSHADQTKALLPLVSVLGNLSQRHNTCMLTPVVQGAVPADEDHAVASALRTTSISTFEVITHTAVVLTVRQAQVMMRVFLRIVSSAVVMPYMAKKMICSFGRVRRRRIGVPQLTAMNISNDRACLLSISVMKAHRSIPAKHRSPDSSSGRLQCTETRQAAPKRNGGPAVCEVA